MRRPSGRLLESLLDGVRGTVSGFENALAPAGVEPVEAVGEQFDPELHEAVDTIEVEPERDGTVTANTVAATAWATGCSGPRACRSAAAQAGRAGGGVKTSRTSNRLDCAAIQLRSD